MTTSFGSLESQAMQAGERPALTDMVDQPDTSRFGDLSSIVQLYPSVLYLMPGESKEVRYVMEGAGPPQLDKLAYLMFFDVSATPRQFARQDQLPSPRPNNRTAIVSTRIPGIYIPETNISQTLRAVLESISNMPGGGVNITLLIETPAIPFAGQVVILGENGQNLGQLDLLVYTRSRVYVSVICFSWRLHHSEVHSGSGHNLLPHPYEFRWIYSDQRFRKAHEENRTDSRVTTKDNLGYGGDK